MTADGVLSIVSILIAFVALALVSLRLRASIRAKKALEEKVLAVAKGDPDKQKVLAAAAAAHTTAEAQAAIKIVSDAASTLDEPEQHPIMSALAAGRRQDNPGYVRDIARQVTEKLSAAG